MAARMCGRSGEPAVRKGPWTLEEDLILVSYISQNGEGSWDNLARSAGLNRNGKSCRLRWLNYLRPGVRRGSITPDEDMVIRDLHSRWGNRWSKIAKHLPGRTDNEIKNYWRTKIHRKPRGRSQLQEPCEDAIGMGMATSEAASTSASSSQSQASSTVWGEYMQTSSFPHPELVVSFAADHIEMAGMDEVAAAAPFVPTEFVFNDGFWNFVDNFWETMPVSDVLV